MLWSGTSWSADGFEVAVLHETGAPLGSPTRFASGEVRALVSFLTKVPKPHATVVDSTNGLLDGLLMAAGLDVRRADPWALAARPVLGSVQAYDLARAGTLDALAVTRLEPTRGTMTGREEELMAAVTASVAALEHGISEGHCLEHGARDDPRVALTFDDGPLPPHTGQVLDVLERYDVRATFFCTGLPAVAHPAQIARMREQGHGVGNHTWSHAYLPELAPSEVVEQVERTGEVLAGVGTTGPSLFRPPYGSCTPQVLDQLAGMGQTTVLWDVVSDDWASPGAEQITRSVLDSSRAGSVVLLHDGGGDRSQTVAALPAIVEGLLERGLRPVPVHELQVELPPAAQTDAR